jgi:hypothetical protein
MRRGRRGDGGGAQGGGGAGVKCGSSTSCDTSHIARARQRTRILRRSADERLCVNRKRALKAMHSSSAKLLCVAWLEAKGLYTNANPRTLL